MRVKHSRLMPGDVIMVGRDRYVVISNDPSQFTGYRSIQMKLVNPEPEWVMWHGDGEVEHVGYQSVAEHNVQVSVDTEPTFMGV